MRAFIKCGLFVPLFVLSCIGLSISYSDNTSAASDYDNAIHIVDTLYYEHPDCGPNGLDGTAQTLIDALRNDDIKWSVSPQTNVIDDFVDAIYDGQYYISISPHTGAIDIRWTHNNDFVLDWVDNTPTLNTSLINTEVKLMGILCGGGDIWRVNYSSDYLLTNSTVTSYVTTTDTVNKALFLYTGDPNYPAGYEGTMMPIPTTESDWVPDIKLHKGDDWTVELSDYNFFTFDKVAFTCGDDELAPVIDWGVYDITDDENNPVYIDTLTFGAPAVVTYTAPKIQEDKRYRITATYTGCEGVTFTSSSTKDFTIKKDGTLKQSDLTTVCILEVFPFVDIEGCLSELNNYLSLLAFRVPDEKQVGGGFISNLASGCRELQVIDTWLLRPNQTVCPQVPSEVRNLVTPFITFALALMSITFIARHRGSS